MIRGEGEERKAGGCLETVKCCGEIADISLTRDKKMQMENVNVIKREWRREEEMMLQRRKSKKRKTCWSREKGET